MLPPRLPGELLAVLFPFVVMLIIYLLIGVRA